MFSLISGRHVGAPLHEHQHGVSILCSVIFLIFFDSMFWINFLRRDSVNQQYFAKISYDINIDDVTIGLMFPPTDIKKVHFGSCKNVNNFQPRSLFVGGEKGKALGTRLNNFP